jgi:hypothetical protein
VRSLCRAGRSVGTQRLGIKLFLEDSDKNTIKIRVREFQLQTSLLAYFKKPGRGWHGRTVELERTLGVGNGSRMDPALFPTPRVRSSGRSREVARVQASFPRGQKTPFLTHCDYNSSTSRGARWRYPCRIPVVVSLGSFSLDRWATAPRVCCPCSG